MNHCSDCRFVAELGHVELQVRLVEQAQADLLAEQRRQAVDPVVHVMAARQLDLDASVLGQAPLRDVHLRHDLDTRGQGVLQLQRRLHDFMQHAVDAITDPEGLLVGLDVDVGGLFLDGIGQDQVDQLDDRSILAGLLEFAGVDLFAVVDDFQVDIIEIPHDIVEGSALVIIFVDRVLDARFKSHDHFDVVAGHELDIVDGEDVRWIGHGDDQRRPGPVDRNQLVLLHDLGRDQLDDVLVDVKFIEIDGGDAVLAREESGEIFFFKIAKLDQAGTEAAARGLLLFESFGELFLVD